MNLRTRMAAVAGVAVALTVVALAATEYEAAGSTLRSQIDSALSDRARQLPPPQFLGNGQGGGPGDFGNHDTPPRNPFGDAGHRGHARAEVHGSRST